MKSCRLATKGFVAHEILIIFIGNIQRVGHAADKHGTLKYQLIYA